MDWVLMAVLFILLVVFAASVLLIGLAIWLTLRTVFSGVSLGDNLPTARTNRRRVRSLFRAKGPAHTTIIEPHPDAHGDVVQAAYPKG